MCQPSNASWGYAGGRTKKRRHFDGFILDDLRNRADLALGRRRKLVTLDPREIGWAHSNLLGHLPQSYLPYLTFAMEVAQTRRTRVENKYSITVAF